MPHLHGRQYFLVSRIFRGADDSEGEGALIAENCAIHVDCFNVLCVFKIGEVIKNSWKHMLHFPLNNAESLKFKMIRNTSGKHTMGRLVIKGVFSFAMEKITMKMNINDYNELLEASRSWP